MWPLRAVLIGAAAVMVFVAGSNRSTVAVSVVGDDSPPINNTLPLESVTAAKSARGVDIDFDSCHVPGPAWMGGAVGDGAGLAGAEGDCELEGVAEAVGDDADGLVEADGELAATPGPRAVHPVASITASNTAPEESSPFLIYLSRLFNART